MHVSVMSGPYWDGSERLMADWGSSGRRFKSCQPDQKKQALTCGDPHQAHGTGGPFWDQYANAYANQDLPAAETMAVFETFPQKPCDEVFRLE